METAHVLPEQSQYTESWSYRITFNNYDLRVNLLSVYDRMGQVFFDKKLKY